MTISDDGSNGPDLDPTNDQVPDERHILIAWGRDYDDVSPLKGVILGGGEQEHFAGDELVAALVRAGAGKGDPPRRNRPGGKRP